MSLTQDRIPVISSLAPLADRYDAWLCDIWGVVHNGVRPHMHASQACIRYRAAGGVVVMISNSPRPGWAVARQMEQIGVPEGTYDAIVTSGDTTRAILQERIAQPLFHLGPERDVTLLQGLDMKVAGFEDAEFVLCTGLYDDMTETPDNYADLLSRMKTRRLPMVCANPDVQVERGDRLIYCAGALAAAYERLGGTVIYTGKPHAPIYEAALDLIKEVCGRDVPRSRVLCIGDGIKTDIAGAWAAGMDAVFVASGLHIDGAKEGDALSPAALESAYSGVSARPVAALAQLKW